MFVPVTLDKKVNVTGVPVVPQPQAVMPKKSRETQRDGTFLDFGQSVQFASAADQDQAYCLITVVLLYKSAPFHFLGSTQWLRCTLCL